MKAILTFEFDADTAEYENEAKLRIDARKWSLVSWDMSQYLRKRLKYEELSKDEEEAIEALKSELYKLLEDYDLSFDG